MLLLHDVDGALDRITAVDKGVNNYLDKANKYWSGTTDPFDWKKVSELMEIVVKCNHF